MSCLWNVLYMKCLVYEMFFYDSPNALLYSPVSIQSYYSPVSIMTRIDTAIHGRILILFIGSALNPNFIFCLTLQGNQCLCLVCTGYVMWIFAGHFMIFWIWGQVEGSFLYRTCCDICALIPKTTFSI